jgi:hypothetical protein
MILKRVYILIFLVSIAAKASFILLPMDENTTESLKAYGITFWCLEKTTKPAGYSTIVVVLSCYQMLQTYARNVKLEALALKCFQMVKLGFRGNFSPSQNMETVILEKHQNCSLYSKEATLG